LLYVELFFSILQIRIVGLRERRDPGFVALDDFLIITETSPNPASCPIRPPEADISATTTATAPPAEDFIGCDFAVDLCDWRTEGSDASSFYWQRANAAQFAGTGTEAPSGDFEHSTEGKEPVQM
jgi:hypothetical protein